MKNILSLICFLFIGSQFVIAQKTIYDKKLPIVFSSAFNKIIPTNDGGLAVFQGYNTKKNPNLEEIIFSLDKNGNIMEGKKFSNNLLGGFTSERAFKQFKDNSFILTYKKTNDKTVNLVKTDIAFNPIWSLNILINNGDIEVHKILELENGNILIVGSSNDIKINSNYYFYAVISPNGNVIRNRRYRHRCFDPNSCLSFIADADVSPSGKLYMVLIGNTQGLISTIVCIDIATEGILFQKNPSLWAIWIG